MKYSCVIIHYIDKATGGSKEMGYEFIHPTCVNVKLPGYDFQEQGTAVLDGKNIDSTWCFVCGNELDVVDE